MLDDMDEVDAQRALATLLPNVLEATGRGETVMVPLVTLGAMSSAARQRLVGLLGEHRLRVTAETDALWIAR